MEHHHRRPHERTPLIRGANGRQGNQENKVSQDSPDYKRWQRLMLTLLVVAYTGYYFCKTNLPLAIPDLEKKEGVTRTDISSILASGYVLYLIGKFMSGYLIDKFGGKATLLAGLIGSIVTTVLFTFKLHPVWFAILRGLNQLCSSVGWGACVKTVRGWYEPSRAAHAVAVASLAETAGDAVVRVTLGLTLVAGVSWNQMFYISAAIAAVMLIPSCFVPASPQTKGFDGPQEQNQAAREAMRDRSVYTEGSGGGLRPFLKNTRVWLLSFELLGVVLIRESFASFVSALIASEIKLSTGYSAVASAIFPTLGAVSAMGGGILLDKTRQNRRALIPLVSLTGLAAALLGMWAVTPSNAGESLSVYGNDTLSPQQMALFLGMIGLVAVFLFAPKVIFDGAFVMDLAGGPEHLGSMTAFVTGVGYLGGCISPFVSGALADSKGWPTAILGLAGIASTIAAASAVYWFLDLKKLKETSRDEESLVPED
ncbi:uncharacterized protein SPPG_06686 [Spizellomyces punctatus DAOM BR117]|uniref:Major facilitator superfamily (MFS) profile domain-containing protein n=1 Tax=Spizellomyces punctatus (strain DAOM BR117) TaxID=645134 RepID=A0A0L0H9Q7_SPIPD|nr:uncharacterized protein SPPG_06686 [Spizellomyces punctatus DAOM BR117]KNC98290.1 hypothetical protein SPPG_06686 [Spizellomyces punctatus DAOM BR117]|eukprot:XP_016606330.1 hypothetical protein SPPG_06686 [Spizellomyces punctatus DAOM BR117]